MPIIKRATEQGSTATEAALPSFKPVIPVREYRWTVRQVGVKVVGQEDSTDGELIEARCLGPLAVHRMRVLHGTRWHQEDGWSITHLPSGLHVLTLKEGAEALRLAGWLFTNHREPFSQETAEGVAALLPEGMLEWIKLCRKERRIM